MKLAERLFQLQTKGVWDTFYAVLPAYAEPLGDSGLCRYRELIENGWDGLPALAPSEESRRSFDPLRMRLERAMETLAELDGDVDTLIRIVSKDLSSPYRFLRVAELRAKHKRYDEGLAWAERGLTEAGKNVDQRLLDFCIEEYLRRGEFAKADAFAWQRFEMRPGAEAFSALMNVANATGQHDTTRARSVICGRLSVLKRSRPKRSAISGRHQVAPSW
jgi:hypothetical protein